MIVKLGMLIVFFGVMVGIGLYCRRHATDVNGFVLGGRSVGPWLTAFAYGTSYFSAVVFVGYAGQFGWKYGIAATWAGIGNALLGSLLAWAVLGRRTRIMTQHLSSATMPEFFGKRFGSDKLKIAASVIIFIFLIPYTASLYNGLSRLFGMAFHITRATGRFGIGMIGLTHSISWQIRRSRPPMSIRLTTMALPALPSKTRRAGSFSFMPMPSGWVSMRGRALARLGQTSSMCAPRLYS